MTARMSNDEWLTLCQEMDDQVMDYQRCMNTLDQFGSGTGGNAGRRGRVPISGGSYTSPSGEVGISRH